MKNLGLSALLVAGLLGLDISPAAAHPGAHEVRVFNDGYRHEFRREQSMPRWLKRNRSFRHWYRHSPLKRFRRISWDQLYEIYRWEHSYFTNRFHGRPHRDWDRDWDRDRNRRHRNRRYESDD